MVARYWVARESSDRRVDGSTAITRISFGESFDRVMPWVCTLSWFNRRDLVEIWLRDAIHGEMQRIRPTYQAPLWSAQTRLNRAEADIDSIELVDLASSVYLLSDAENSGALNEAKLGASFEQWLDFLETAFALTDVMHFFSSGSRGERSLHAHPLNALTAEVDAILQRFPMIKQAKRVVLCVPGHHIYGFLFGVLLPFALNCSVRRMVNPAAAELRSVLEPGDVCVSIPRQLAALVDADRAAKAALVDDRAGKAALAQAKATAPANCFLSAGASLPDAIYERFASTLVIDIYGSTETAGIGTRCQPGLFSLLPRFERAEGQPMELLDCYQQRRPVLPPDGLQFASSDQFAVGERLDRIVQVSGVNVALAKVEAIIQGFAEGVHAEVFLRGKAPDARIAARLRGVDSAALTRLQDYLRSQLQSAEMPVDFELS